MEELISMGSPKKKLFNINPASGSTNEEKTSSKPKKRRKRKGMRFTVLPKKTVVNNSTRNNTVPKNTSTVLSPKKKLFNINRASGSTNEEKTSSKLKKRRKRKGMRFTVLPKKTVANNSTINKSSKSNTTVPKNTFTDLLQPGSSKSQTSRNAKTESPILSIMNRPTATADSSSDSSDNETIFKLKASATCVQALRRAVAPQVNVSLSHLSYLPETISTVNAVASKNSTTRKSRPSMVSRVLARRTLGTSMAADRVVGGSTLTRTDNGRRISRTQRKMRYTGKTLPKELRSILGSASFTPSDSMIIDVNVDATEEVVNVPNSVLL